MKKFVALLLALPLSACTISDFAKSAADFAEQICKFRPIAQSVNDIVQVSGLNDPLAVGNLICDIFTNGKAEYEEYLAKRAAAAAAEGESLPVLDGRPILGYSIEYKGVIVKGYIVD